MRLELQPKGFQQEAQKRLRIYMEEARLDGDPARAFLKLTGKLYRPLPGMERTPSVCLRLPTGGGKTILAAMCVATVARSYLDQEFPMVLWLVPSDTVRTQTFRALANRDHPYRVALGKEFGDRVRVFDVADFALMTPQDVRSNVCVVISTFAALQTTSTAGRRVYSDNENLEGHFDAAARSTTGLELIEAGLARAGTAKLSFANLLKVRRPLVIVDEAHRFMTPLADTVRQRIGAGVMLELTATPSERSNELYRATASELKDADMIKLPVVLAEHTGVWQQAVHEAVATRQRLAEIALGEQEYVRPLLLIQAQDAGREGEWEAIKRYLLEEQGLDEREIAVHTGDVRELSEYPDLFARNCPITTILTVQALREGWDCSFAYVLCSAANIGDLTNVEQLLGRVLRMPYAKRRMAPELNKAYAHVASSRFQDAARSLRDCLVHMGFETPEAEQALQGSLGEGSLFDQSPPLKLVLMEAPPLDALAQEERGRVSVAELASGQVEVEVHGPISNGLEEVLLAQLPAAVRSKVSVQVAEHNERWQPSPAQRGVRFRVPRLTIEDELGQRVLFDKDSLREVAPLDLNRYPAELSGFEYNQTTQRYTLDVVGETIELQLMGQEQQLPLGMNTTSMTVVDLVSWLDPKLRDLQLNKRELSAWLLAGVTRQLAKPGMTLAVLDRGRFILLRKFQEALASARARSEADAYQDVLFGQGSTVGTDDAFSFQYGLEYLPNSECKGIRFRKHYYRVVGEMKNTGEECDCAIALDQNAEVKHWVRNLAGRGREHTSFWLQTATDRFYPDFVAELLDGTILVVEFKGEDRKTADDAREKDQLGQLWARRSGGRGRFLMAEVAPRGMSLSEQIAAAVGDESKRRGLA